MKRIPLIIIIPALLSLTSCMTIVQSIFGWKDPKPISESVMNRYAKHFNIPPAANFSLDSSYLHYLFSLDTSLFKHQAKNHYQPLQALYFNKQGGLTKFYINCYAGGFPTLKWNRDGKLDIFPPGDQAPVDTLLNLDRQLSFLNVTKESVNPDLKSPDYVVFIYWNTFMKRHSRHLIHSIRKNCALSDPDKVKIIYVNNDNFCSCFYKN